MESVEPRATRPAARILIVDDDPDILRIVETILSVAGFSVLRAASGVEALKVLRDTVPDLVLMDLKMPEMDGYQTCLHLRADPRLASVPVIFLSAYLNQAPLELLGSQVVDKIQKPFDLQRLVGTVRRHLEQ